MKNVRERGAPEATPEAILSQAETWLVEGRLTEAVGLLEDWAERLDHPGEEPYFDAVPSRARVHELLRTIAVLRSRLEGERQATMAELDAVRAQVRFERSGQADPPPWVFDQA